MGSCISLEMGPGRLCSTPSCTSATPDLALQALKEKNDEEFHHCVTSGSFDLDAPLPQPEGNVVRSATLLETALRLGNHSAVAVLLGGARRARPDLHNRQLDCFPLHVALGPSSAARHDTVKLLVDRLTREALDASNSSGQTALHLAVQRKEQGVEALQLLLARGANPQLADSRGQTALHLARHSGCHQAVQLLSQAAQLAPEDKFAKLLNDLPSYPSDPVSEDWRELLAEAKPSDLGLVSNGKMTLIQTVVDRSLIHHLRLLLEKGASPNCTTLRTPLSPLMLAARDGNLPVMQILLDNKDTKYDHVDPEEDTNVLTTVLKKPLQGSLSPGRDYSGCLEALLTVLERRAEEDKEQCRTMVNQQDRNQGNSPLHYAAQFWSQEVVARILRLGANVGLKNRKDELAISGVQPKTMEDFLDNDCLTSNKRNPADDKFSITFNYSFLTPPSAPAQRDSSVDPESCPFLPCTKDNKREREPVQMLETDVLLGMSKCFDHRALLKHPVITSFLTKKWAHISKWYNINIVFIISFVAILTGYIFINYAGPSLNISIPECSGQLKDADKARPYGNHAFIWILLTAYLTVLFLREVIQLFVAPLKYLFSFENILEIVLITLVALLLFYSDPGCHSVMKREISAAVLLLSWMELITMLGRHPSWHRCNVYSTMFFKVLYTFFSFLLWYSLFLIAFGLGFFILLHTDPSEAAPEGEEPKFFNHLGLAIVKTFSMFVGELEFSSIPFQVSPGFSYIFFLIFVFLMVVVLMNLLNGLAVSDSLL